MTSPIDNVRSPWARFLAHLFVILVAWTGTRLSDGGERHNMGGKESKLNSKY